MKRLELAHIVRAACDITGDEHVLVLGSQSMLWTFDEDDLPGIPALSTAGVISKNRALTRERTRDGRVSCRHHYSDALAAVQGR